MANKHRGEIKVEIGGKERTLRLDFNAIAELEERFDRPISEIFPDDGRVQFRAIRDALWIGLKHEDRRLTPMEVGRWLGEDGALMKAAETLSTAVAAALPDPPPPADEEKAKTENP